MPAIENTTVMTPLRRDAVFTTDHLEAARQGATVHGWVDGKSGLAAETLLTDVSIIYDLSPGQRVMVCRIVMGIRTASDSMAAQIGYIDTDGVFRGLASTKTLKTGAAPEGRQDFESIYHHPLVARYKDGARRITFKVLANDANAECDLSWTGVVEKDI